MKHTIYYLMRIAKVGCCRIVNEKKIQANLKFLQEIQRGLEMLMFILKYIIKNYQDLDLLQ